MRVRLNNYHDLPMLLALYEGAGHGHICGWTWTGDWTGWWAVCEDSLGRLVGCLQLSMSRPQATLESLCVPLAFSKRQRATIIRRLVAFAFETLRQLGVQSVRFQLDETRGDSVRIAQRYRARFLHQHPTFIRELHDASW